MIAKTLRFFICSAGALLILVAMAKIASSFGRVAALNVRDPLFNVPFRYLFLIVGYIEMTIGVICFAGRGMGLKVGLLCCLATSFLVYRIGLGWIGYHGPCHCLGNLTDQLHISAELADNVMKGILGYLLIGSYACIVGLWKLHYAPSLSSLHQRHTGSAVSDGNGIPKCAEE